MELNDIKRDAYAEMQKWKAGLRNHKTSLEIAGARQVGKTYLIQKFAKENYTNVHYIDMFDKDARKKVDYADSIMAGNKDFIRILFPDLIDQPDTVAIIDEVQEYAYTYNLIKFFVNEMKSDLIVSGSFLGKTMQREYFIACSERTTIEVKSLSFPEFLAIFELRDLYESLDLYGNSDIKDYETIKEVYTLYMLIGGYPNVVKQFLNNQSVDEMYANIKSIIDLFCNDSRRYFNDISDATILPLLLRGVADFLLRDKRGSLNFFNELPKLNYNIVTNTQAIQHAISWLMESRIISPCEKYTNLDSRLSVPQYRYYFPDIGIANYMYDLVQINHPNKVGRLAENFVYRCILDNKTFKHDTPCFAMFGNTEIDFFDYVNGETKVYKIAVEVKSGRGAGKSVTELLRTRKVDCLINVFGDTYGGKTENILTIPIYLFGRLNIDEIVPPMKNGAGEILKKIYPGISPELHNDTQ